MGGRAGGGASGGMGSRARGGGGWPTLTGSEKQISWANDIRKGAQNALDFVKPYADNPKSKALVSKWESQMKGMTSAKQWIDSRYKAPRSPGKAVGDSETVKKYNINIAKGVILDFGSWLGH